jgi:hypothetical protein
MSESLPKRLAERLKGSSPFEPPFPKNKNDLIHLWQFRRFTDDPARFAVLDRLPPSYSTLSNVNLISLFLSLEEDRTTTNTFFLYVRENPLGEVSNFAWICHALYTAPSELKPLLSKLDLMLYNPDAVFFPGEEGKKSTVSPSKRDDGGEKNTVSPSKRNDGGEKNTVSPSKKNVRRKKKALS